MKRTIVAGAVAALAIAGGGAAFAATQGDGDPRAESQAIVSDAAKELGIEPAKLTAALKQAFANRIDAAVADGRLTKEQGDELKQRIQDGDFPLFGPGFGFHKGIGVHVGLDAAATYLGLSGEELRTSLESGKTLAEVAKERGKSVDGLIDAMVAEATKQLDEAVAAGKLTKERRDAMVADLKERITELVNNGRPGVKRAFGPGFHMAWAA
jgi:polyhydroxyalkanoate synthesis regulator phasin